MGYGIERAGLGNEACEFIVKSTLENSGGTFNEYGYASTPTHGYLVSVDEDRGIVVPLNEFTATDIALFALNNMDYIRSVNDDPGEWLNKGTKYIGTWVSDGYVYIDVATHVFNIGNAFSLAHRHNQQAIWDCENECERIDYFREYA